MADVKERILARIDPDEVIGFAKELVKVPSYTTDETPLAEFLHRFLQAERLESRLQEVDPGRFQTIARLPGVGGRPSLMFDGHLDIDPIPGGWVRDPWTPTVENDRFHGAGIYNMKGGDAAMVMAVVAARRAGVRLRGDVWLAGVVEELQGGRGHRPLAPERRSCRHGDRPRALQHPEHHHQAHRCRRVPGPRDRPVGPHLCGEREPDLPGLPRLCVGSIVGGRGRQWELRGPNIVPDFCSVFIDVRFPAGLTPESILADVRGALDAVGASDPDFRYEIEWPARP